MELYEVRQDPDYQHPEFDADEVRERTLPDGTQKSYRYMHGSFPNKSVKFSFCIPMREDYQGRFYHYLSPFPSPDEELSSQGHTGLDDKIAFCLTHGAAFVESNMGSHATFGGSTEPKIVMKSSSAVAELCRETLLKIYGGPRPYGYVYGGSGGSYKTFSCIENSTAWDGAVPYVIGSPVSLPNTITLHAQGQRTLRKCFSKIIDALDAGGSGDMYENLNTDERRMLKEITAMGFPPRAWFVEALGEINDGSLPVLAPGIKAVDPQYFEDFWTVDGYLGADPTSGAVKDRLQFEGVVKFCHVPGVPVQEDVIDSRNGVDTSWKKMLTDVEDGWIELENAPIGDLYLNGCQIQIQTGDAAGKNLLLDGLEGNILKIGACYGMDDVHDITAKIKPGDVVKLDNSDYIAIQSYYRHQVPSDLSFHAWDQFRNSDGTPALPQRQNVFGPSMTGTGGTVQHGNFQGKVIVIQALMDESTCPWCGDWYRNKVIEAKGSEDDFRIYYMDHCMHGDTSTLGNTRVINYVGALHQALLDLAAWVEKGKKPLASSRYQLVDGQILVPDHAKERKGIQSVVSLTANGSTCAHVKAGEEVHFKMYAETPENAGILTKAEYCFKDSTELIDTQAPWIESTLQHVFADNVADAAVSEFTHIYETPGTWFAAVRVSSSAVEDDPFTQVQNLARVRVIVSE